MEGQQRHLCASRAPVGIKPGWPWGSDTTPDGPGRGKHGATWAEVGSFWAKEQREDSSKARTTVECLENVKRLCVGKRPLESSCFRRH